MNKDERCNQSRLTLEASEEGGGGGVKLVLDRLTKASVQLFFVRLHIF